MNFFSTLVVRILGNDNTHYERDYENIDFDVLKQYLNIFIEMIEVQIKIKNPPVSRLREYKMDNKIGKNAKLLISSDLIYTLTAVFIETFLVAYFLKVTNESITTISIYFT